MKSRLTETPGEPRATEGEPPDADRLKNKKSLEEQMDGDAGRARDERGRALRRRRRQGEPSRKEGEPPTRRPGRAQATARLSYA